MSFFLHLLISAAALYEIMQAGVGLEWVEHAHEVGLLGEQGYMYVVDYL